MVKIGHLTNWCTMTYIIGRTSIMTIPLSSNFVSYSWGAMRFPFWSWTSGVNWWCDMFELLMKIGCPVERFGVQIMKSGWFGLEEGSYVRKGVEMSPCEWWQKCFEIEGRICSMVRYIFPVRPCRTASVRALYWVQSLCRNVAHWGMWYHSTPVGQMANFDHQNKFRYLHWIDRGDE